MLSLGKSPEATVVVVLLLLTIGLFIASISATLPPLVLLKGVEPCLFEGTIVVVSEEILERAEKRPGLVVPEEELGSVKADVEELLVVELLAPKENLLKAEGSPKGVLPKEPGNNKEKLEKHCKQ